MVNDFSKFSILQSDFQINAEKRDNEKQTLYHLADWNSSFEINPQKKLVSSVQSVLSP
jgi:hypothetical protein